MDRRITLALLFALIVAHIAISANYAASTPYRTAGFLMGQGRPSPIPDIGAPDERQHTNYIIDLVTTDRFPVFNPHDPNATENYERHQPPLYYALGTVWCKITGIHDFQDRDSGLRLRALNCVIGAGTVAGTFFLAYWGFRREDVALAATAFVALLPMLAALSGSITNDALLICLCTWVLALCAKGVRDGWTTMLAVEVGFLTGLALLTKTTALALAPILLLVAFIKQPSRPTPAMVGVCAAACVLVVAPWWARNQVLYGDPLALKVFNQAFANSPKKETIEQVITATNPDASPALTYWKDWVGWWTARSFFGTFGYMDIWMNEHGTAFTSAKAPNTLYRMLLAGTILCFLGWLLSLKKTEWKESTSVQAINGAFILVAVLLFLKFNTEYFQAQGRYVLPAIGPIACGVAIGLTNFLKNRGLAAAGVIAAIFLGLNIFALSRLPDEFKIRIDGPPLGTFSHEFNPHSRLSEEAAIGLSVTG
jgi:4-amino-4-deoxy-L-arabinose transferase-like glycosyltransferase